MNRPENDRAIAMMWLILIVVVFALLASGCQSQSAALSKGIQAGGEIEGHLKSAHDSAVKVQKLVSGTAAAYADDVISDIADAQAQMPAIRKGLDIGATAITQRDDERTWWISYRVHRDFKWTVFGVVGLLIVLLALWVLSQVAGPVGIVVAPIFHTLTGGLVLIGRSIGKAVKSAPSITIHGIGQATTGAR